MQGDAWLLALGLMLVFEGLMPFVSPKAWRSVVSQITQRRDGQIRFSGLLGILAGLVLLWLVG